MRDKLRVMLTIDEQHADAWQECTMRLRDRLRHAVEVASGQARALLIVSIGVSFMFMAAALFMPLVRIIDTMGMAQ